MSKQSNDDDSMLEQTANDTPHEQMAHSTRLVRIRTLNDALRCHGLGGLFLVTEGIAALAPDHARAVLHAVAAFDRFTPENDPWREHDCAALTVEAIEIIWKIDYYDRQRQFHSPDPADPKLTLRVLTVMLASEY